MNFPVFISTYLEEALSKAGFSSADVLSQIKASSDSKFGDYQFNGSMGLAKEAKVSPRKVAEKIVEFFALPDVLEPVEIAGPGFLNLRIKPQWLAQKIQEMAADPRLGVLKPEKVKTFVIDFSSPNVAKPMHVGHLRSTILGDSLARTLRFLGHTVITDNHLGDWGTQFGIILHGYKNMLDEKAFQNEPVKELARLYVEVRKLFKTPEEIAKGVIDPVQNACRDETAKMHKGDQTNLELWRKFMPLCLGEIDLVYQRLGVRFDHTYGESFYQPFLNKVVQDLSASGLARESEGALAIFLTEDATPALVRKSDGAFTYMTTDLATIQYRVEQWKPDAILYVVDSRQSLHFSQLFQIAQQWLGQQTRLEHISFGSVLGADRKPIKTRSGDAVASLDQLLDEAVRLAKEVYQAAYHQEGETQSKESLEDLNRVGDVVGIGAVKYADLCQNRTSDYVFNWEKMMAMEGNTATYMQYAYARNRSIFRKGEFNPDNYRNASIPVLLDTAEERGLALQLFRFEEAITLALVDYKPSLITSYLWDVAKAYSVFFQNCPVLKAPNEGIRQSRLLLCDLTARVLKQGLELLGISVLEKM
ncbi:MAG: arginine--tRNA ligase [Gemmataceae bacterium]|nr:arginine--tRNA ligase [Gemmataceae bacterium]MBJ7430881.1 arginine--tRNA ligase [Gemmataceae bacterium]